MPNYVLDCGSTGCRLYTLKNNRVVALGDEKFPFPIHVVVATPVQHPRFIKYLRDQLVATRVTGYEVDTVFVGMTAGMRSNISRMKGGAVKKRFIEGLDALLGGLRALRRVHVDVQWIQHRFRYMTPTVESVLEHEAVKHAIVHCPAATAPYQSHLFNIGRDGWTYGHVGIGGASIQISWAPVDGAGPLQHHLLPFSFTTPDVYHVTERYFHTLRLNRRGRPRCPRGYYFCIESWYWVIRDVLGSDALDTAMTVRDLLGRLRTADKSKMDPRNAPTLRIIENILRDIMRPESYMIIMGHNYCGGEVTWALAQLIRMEKITQKRLMGARYASSSTRRAPGKTRPGRSRRRHSQRFRKHTVSLSDFQTFKKTSSPMKK